LLCANSTITDALPREELEKLFDLGHHMKHVDTIFDRVFGAS
jgi:Adenylosuccinate lyase